MYAVGTVGYSSRLSLYNKLGRGKLCNQIHILTLYRATDLVKKKHVSIENENFFLAQMATKFVTINTFMYFSSSILFTCSNYITQGYLTLILIKYGSHHETTAVVYDLSII